MDMGERIIMNLFVTGADCKTNITTTNLDALQSLSIITTIIHIGLLLIYQHDLACMFLYILEELIYKPFHPLLFLTFPLPSFKKQIA